ncbi:MAG: tRNA 2-thiocytidine biosynthesis protein TtcA [Clostridiales bacterium]|nr:tRNA 2-thiocytidine biosynthesis protein TtcA [Clostridiales bacterium]
MKLQRILSFLRKAVEDYHMIQAGDKIAVGVSGGKDSLSLLLALKNLQRFYPEPFELEAITVSLGFSGTDYSPIAQLCQKIQVPYTVISTDIGKIIFDDRQEKNPCSLCSKMRKGALNDAAVEKGCNKIALGHNKDDVIETFFMSLFYEGRIHTFAPVSYLDRKKVTVIRPLLYLPESDAKKFALENNLPIVKNPCPADGSTKRQETKELVAQLSAQYENLSEKVFGAIMRSSMKGWNGGES